MLQIKTYIAPSKIQGIGLFAAEDIQKGTETWRFTPPLDVRLSVDEVENLTPLHKDFVKKYAALSKESNSYILCGDDARFINHSKTPYIIVGTVATKGELNTVAARDIKKGEELTIDYQEIDQVDAKNPNSELYP